jgi:AraC family transcriptional regulator
MDWTTRFSKAMDYIENTLEDTTNLAYAAYIAGCSPFHFARSFEFLFGISLEEYLIRRKLSRAADDLAARDVTVGEVAQRYGWVSVAPFVDAFKRRFGISPSDPRLRDLNLHKWPPLRLTNTLKRGLVSGARIVSLPGFCARGFFMRTTSEDNQRDNVIPRYWRQLGQSGSLRSLACESGPLGLLGICWDYDKVTSSFAYAVAVESSGEQGYNRLDESFSLLVPPATYAVFPLATSLPDVIQATWKAIYGEWFPDSGFEHAGTPEFESFTVPGRPVRQDLPPSAIWVPIRAHSTE